MLTVYSCVSLIRQSKTIPLLFVAITFPATLLYAFRYGENYNKVHIKLSPECNLHSNIDNIAFETAMGSRIPAKTDPVNGAFTTTSARAISSGVVTLKSLPKNPPSASDFSFLIGPSSYDNYQNLACSEIEKTETNDKSNDTVTYRITARKQINSLFSHLPSRTINYKGDIYVGFSAVLFYIFIILSVFLFWKPAQKETPNTQHKWTILRAIHLLALTLSLAFLLAWRGPAFQTNDDIAIRAVLSGHMGNGEPYPYDLFQSFAYGWLVSSMYYLFPTLDWHALFLLISSCLAMTAIGIYSYSPTKHFQSLTLFLLIFLTTFLSSVSTYQFTVTAGLVGAAGVFTLLSTTYATASKHNFLSVVTPVGLLLLGCAIRLDATLLSTVLFFPTIFLFILKSDFQHGNLKRFILPAIAFTAVVAFAAVDKLSYRLGDIKPNNDFLHAQVSLRDEKLWLEPYLNSIMIANDFTDLQQRYYWSWIMLDDKIISTQDLTRIKVQRNSLLTKQAFLEQLRTSIATHSFLFLKYSLCFLAIYILIAKPYNKPITLIFAAGQVLFTFLLIIFLDTWLKLPPRLVSIVEISSLLSFIAILKSSCNTVPIAATESKIWDKIRFSFSLVLLLQIASTSNPLYTIMHGVQWKELHDLDDLKDRINFITSRDDISRVMSFQHGLFLGRPFSDPILKNVKLVPATSYSQSKIFFRSAGVPTSEYFEAFIREKDCVWLLGSRDDARLLAQCLTYSAGKLVIPTRSVPIDTDLHFFRFGIAQTATK
jgi:hypothetical protein